MGEDTKTSRILLVAPVGFAVGWAPLGIAVLKAFIKSSTKFDVDTLNLSVKFTDYLEEKYPAIADFNHDMGEWGTSIHELYFGAMYFGHASPTSVIAAAMKNRTHRTDIYQAPPWIPAPTIIPAMEAYHVRRALQYCTVIHDYSWARIADMITQSPPFLVGFSCTPQQIISGAYLARKIRKIWPYLKIIVGGSAITTRTVNDYLYTFDDFDALVVGDGEEALAQIAAGLFEYGVIPRVPGVVTRNVILESDAILPARHSALATMPPPNYDELKPMLQSGKYPVTTWLSRGCSWGKCAFCSIPKFQRQYTHRGAEEILEEVLILHKKYGSRSFRFGDWEVNGDPETLLEFCNLVCGESLNFEFWGEVNSRHFTLPLAFAMKKAGFASVQMGLEGFSGSLLRKMKKPTTVLQNIRAMQIAHQVHMSLFSNILYNFPGEQQEEVYETITVLRTIRHLVKPPILLELTEFLCEVEADIYSQLPTESTESLPHYEFEQYAFPPHLREREGLYFLRNWNHPTSKTWLDVHDAILSFYESPSEFRHSVAPGGQVSLIDTRFGSERRYQLEGLNARVYAHLLHGITPIRQLHSIADLPTLEECLSWLERHKLIMREKGRVLALSVP